MESQSEEERVEKKTKYEAEKNGLGKEEGRECEETGERRRVGGRKRE